MNSSLSVRDLILLEYPRYPIAPVHKYDQRVKLGRLLLGSTKIRLTQILTQPHSQAQVDTYVKFLKVEQDYLGYPEIHPLARGVMIGMEMDEMVKAFLHPDPGLILSLGLTDGSIQDWNILTILNMTKSVATTMNQMIHFLNRYFEFDSVLKILISRSRENKRVFWDLFYFWPEALILCFQFFPELGTDLKMLIPDDTRVVGRMNKIGIYSAHICRAIDPSIVFKSDFILRSEELMEANAILDSEWVLQIRARIYFESSLTSRLIGILNRGDFSSTQDRVLI